MINLTNEDEIKGRKWKFY